MDKTPNIVPTSNTLIHVYNVYSMVQCPDRAAYILVYFMQDIQ